MTGLKGFKIHPGLREESVRLSSTTGTGFRCEVRTLVKYFSLKV